MQAEAHELAALLQSHPHFKHVQHSGSGRGYVVYTESAESGIQDRVPLTGITASLQQTYWPHYRYEARRGTGAGAGAGGAVGAATGRRKIPAPRAYAAITNTAVLVQRLTPLRRSAGVAHVAPLYPAMATAAAAAAANASSRGGGGVGYNGNGDDDDDDDGVGVGDENENNNNNNQRNRKTKRARILDAMDEGHLVHQQVALYTRFLVQDRETCVERFKSVLSISSPPQSVHPATRRIIQSFNEMTPSSSSSSAAATLAPFGGAGAGAGAGVNGGRFIPVWSEVVVADLPALLRGEKGPWGTAVDLLVLDTYTHSLTVVEIKTTTADFEVGKHRMRYSLSFMDDSPLNQARVQLAVTMELFRRTYRELITDTRPLMGMVLMVTRDGRDYKRYYMDDSDAQHIIRALQRDGWIKPAYA